MRPAQWAAQPQQEGTCLLLFSLHRSERTDADAGPQTQRLADAYTCAVPTYVLFVQLTVVSGVSRNGSICASTVVIGMGSLRMPVARF